MIIMNNRKVLCTQPRFLVRYISTQIHLKYCQEIAWVQYYVSRNEEQYVRRVVTVTYNVDIHLSDKINFLTTVKGRNYLVLISDDI